MKTTPVIGKWYAFSKLRGTHQKLPPERKTVLVVYAPKDRLSSPVVASGYLRFSGGDKQCPYFVVPGIGGEPIGWCDCVVDFDWFNFNKTISVLMKKLPPQPISPAQAEE